MINLTCSQEDPYYCRIDFRRYIKNFPLKFHFYKLTGDFSLYISVRYKFPNDYKHETMLIGFEDGLDVMEIEYGNNDWNKKYYINFAFVGRKGNDLVAIRMAPIFSGNPVLDTVDPYK